MTRARKTNSVCLPIAPRVDVRCAARQPPRAERLLERGCLLFSLPADMHGGVCVERSDFRTQAPPCMFGVVVSY
eukprot:scaffold123817_cov51-Phaeocystis_antarctica.AAC.2